MRFLNQTQAGFSVVPIPKKRIQKLKKAKINLSKRGIREFEKFVLSLNNGVLKNKYFKQHNISSKTSLDFFFFEPKLGIEISGPFPKTKEQKAIEKQKLIDCTKHQIILLKIKYEEVFGNKLILTTKLRDSWGKAKRNKSKNK